MWDRVCHNHSDRYTSSTIYSVSFGFRFGFPFRIYLRFHLYCCRFGHKNPLSRRIYVKVGSKFASVEYGGGFLVPMIVSSNGVGFLYAISRVNARISGLTSPIFLMYTSRHFNGLGKGDVCMLGQFNPPLASRNSFLGYLSFSNIFFAGYNDSKVAAGMRIVLTCFNIYKGATRNCTL